MSTVMETQCSVHVVTKVIVAWQYIERYLKGVIELTLSYFGSTIFALHIWSDFIFWMTHYINIQYCLSSQLQI